MHCVIWHDQWESPHSMALHTWTSKSHRPFSIPLPSVNPGRWNSMRGYNMCFWQMRTCNAMWSGFVFAWFLQWGDLFVYYRLDCLLPPEKTNCSNEVQGNYVGDIAFASASSLGSVTRSCERSIFSKTKIVWRCCGCAVSAPAQCCTSFQFIFVWCGQYTCVAQQKNLADAWRTRRRRDSFFRP